MWVSFFAAKAGRLSSDLPRVVLYFGRPPTLVVTAIYPGAKTLLKSVNFFGY